MGVKNKTTKPTLNLIDFSYVLDWFWYQSFSFNGQSILTCADSLAGEGKAEGDMLQKLNLEIVKDREIERQSNYQKDLETQLSKLQTINGQLKGTIKAMQTDTTIISECLEKVKTDMVVYSSKKDSQVTANKILEKKLLELESCNKELETHKRISTYQSAYLV